MITFICCSIDPQMARSLQHNIESTIGDMPFEFICFDNRETNYGICKVYNSCADRAKYDYLCFLHEDIIFNTPNWGEMVVNKLREESCGSIGFAGSQYKSGLLRSPGWGWLDSLDIIRENLTQHYFNARLAPRKEYVNPDNLEFSQVVTLDGLCIFVRKSVWAECRFDEKLLTGFHYYDIDFSMSTSLNYTNYVCNIVDVEHLSEGTTSEVWETATILCHNKWKHKFPLMSTDFREKYGRDRDALAMIEYYNIERAIEASHPFFNDKKEIRNLVWHNLIFSYKQRDYLQRIYKSVIKIKRVYLFHFIPLLKVEYQHHKKSFLLFGLVPIWRTKSKK